MLQKSRRRRCLRRIKLERLNQRITLSANALLDVVDESAVHSIPFEVSGAGGAPGGLPLFPGGTSDHFATGRGTRLGTYSGGATFEFGGFTNNDPTSGSGTFSSAAPFVFESADGDQITFQYGREDFGADGPGQFTILPQADGNVVVEFVAEFTIVPEQSTGRFSKYTEGSFVMIATSDPFSPVPDDTGFTEPFTYSWVGEGTIGFPVGQTFEVTTLNDSGEGSLRDAIDDANATEGIDTITFADDLRGKIGLDSELVISDDVTIMGPGARRIAVSGEHDSRVFRIDPFATDQIFGLPTDDTVSVEIHDLAIINGFTEDAPGFPTADPFGFPVSGFGGGIYNRGSDLALESVLMKNNQAGSASTALAAGGAIANEFGGTVTINDSQFVRNRAVASAVAGGGAFTQDVGPTFDGLGTESSATVITDSRFTRNSASALETNPAAAGALAPFAGFAFGGAVLNLASQLTVEDTSFFQNTATGGDGVDGNLGGTAMGGALFTSDFAPFIDANVTVPGRDAHADLLGVRFGHNRAEGGRGDGQADGGDAIGGAVAAGISFFPGAATIAESSFVNNRAHGGASGVRSAGGDAIGGGLGVVAGASVSATDLLFARNRAEGGEGRGSGDGGDGRGGALGLGLLRTSVPTPFESAPFIPLIVMSDALLIGNSASGGDAHSRSGAGGEGRGGAISVDSGATASFDSLYVIRNSARGGNGRDAGDGLGGGIHNGAASTTLTGSTVVANAARGGRGRSRRGGGEGLGGGLFNAELGTFTLDVSSQRHTRFNRPDNVSGEITLLDGE